MTRTRILLLAIFLVACPPPTPPTVGVVASDERLPTPAEPVFWGDLSEAFQRAASKRMEPSVEPPLLFALEIDGQYRGLAEGVSFDLNPSSRQQQATLHVADHRVFRQLGLSMRYPRYYTFEVSMDDGPQWTLSGNDHILIMSHHSGIDHVALRNAVADELVKTYGQASGAKRTPVKERFGKYELEGARVDATIATTRLTQAVLSLPTSDGLWLFIVQDSPTASNPHTPEYDKAMAMLSASFEIDAP